jgi:hypothetical protein
LNTLVSPELILPAPTPGITNPINGFEPAVAVIEIEPFVVALQEGLVPNAVTCGPLLLFNATVIAVSQPFTSIFIV